MPVLMQVSAVVVTLAVVVIAVAVLRAMRHLEVASHEFTRTAEAIRESVRQAEAVTRRLEELAGSMQTVVPPIRAAAARIEALTERATQMSNVMLDQVETPLRNTLAVLAGIRTGTRSLLGALTRRAGRRPTNGQFNGGYGHD